MMKIRKGPDGVHLFARQTGTNILLDEEIPERSLWTNSPRQVSIALTNICNLSCSHCYAPKYSASLAKESIKRWMTELDNAGCFSVGFGGGEPTLYPDLVELCSFGHQETGLAMSLTTHGHQLSSKLIDELKCNVNFIRISMDGVGATYEAIRGRKFSHLLATLKLVRGKIPFGINYVVNSKTIKDLPEAAKIAELNGATELLLLPEVSVGRGVEITNSTLCQLQNWVLDYRGPLLLTVSAANRDSFDYAAPLEKEPAFMSFVHIDASGHLKSSSFDEAGIKIDNEGVMSAFEQLTNSEYIE